MLKVKDGFAKAIDSTASGLVTEVLLSNGGHTQLTTNTGGKLKIISPAQTLSPDTIQIRTSSNNPVITTITPPDAGEIATYVIVTKDVYLNMASSLINNIMWVYGDNPNEFSSSTRNIELVITGFNYNNEVFYRGTIGKYY